MTPLAPRTLRPVDTAAALASRSTTRPLLSQPQARALPVLLCSGPSPFEATRQPSKGPRRAADLRPAAHRYAIYWAKQRSEVVWVASYVSADYQQELKRSALPNDYATASKATVEHGDRDVLPVLGRAIG